MAHNDIFQNPGIRRIHEIFKKARSNFCRFYQNYDETKIRFSFGEIESEGFIFRVKFSTTHKTVKFLVDPSGAQAQYQQLEKTTNIVEDIATLNKVVKSGLLILDSRDILETLHDLFTWGMWEEKKRDNDIFRVDAVLYNDRIKRDDKHLYFGLINAVQIVGKKDDKVEVILHFYKGGKYTIYELPELVPFIRVGRLILINYKDQYNILTFNSSKHHVDFAPSDFNLCVEYFNTIRF